MKAAFSDVSIRALKPPERGQVFLWDEKLPTFGIRVSQGGSKTFILKHQNRFTTIGRFPVLSLSEARTEAKRLLAEYTLGRVRPQSITFPQAIEVFLSEKEKGRRPRTVADLKDRLSRHFPFTGQLADVTHQDIAKRLAQIRTPREHNAALRVGKTFFTWATNRRYITDNPCRGLFPHSISPRARLLTDDEVRSIWRATEQPTTFNTIVRLLILTGQRRNEIASLKAEYIKDDVCALPSALTKNKREHIFPIGRLAASILPRTKSGLYFAARGTPSRSFSGFSKAKKVLDRRLGGTVTPWTLHDLRRYYASTMARLGVKQEVTERLLNHRSGIISGIAAVYTLHDFMPEMKQAIERYEQRLRQLFDLNQ